MGEANVEEKLTCPYCGSEQYGHEPNEISGYCCLERCEHCGKEFWYSVSVRRTYSTEKGD